MSRVTRGIRQPSPVPNGYSGTGTVPGGYPCLTGTYHGYPGVPIPVLHLSHEFRTMPVGLSTRDPLSPLILRPFKMFERIPSSCLGCSLFASQYILVAFK